MPTHRIVAAALLAASLVALPACHSAASGAKPPRPAPVNTAPAGDSSGGSIEKLLEGRFPGVIVRRDGSGGLRVLVRGGESSFYGSSEPLYVLDGTPLPQGNNGLLFINPYDIERIEVLRNPADIAIYGVRGANGVVRITTKHSH